MLFGQRIIAIFSRVPLGTGYDTVRVINVYNSQKLLFFQSKVYNNSSKTSNIAKKQCKLESTCSKSLIGGNV